MQSEPERNPSRPSPAQSAEALLAALDVSANSETEILSAAYSRFFDGPSEGSSPSTQDPRAVPIIELHRFANSHLDHARSLKVNAHVEYIGRMFSDPRIAALKNEPLSTHCLLELRTRDGGSALLTDYRIVPIAGGVATTHISTHMVRPGELKFQLRPMLSPRAFGAEVENLIELIDQRASFQEFEKRSFMYCAFRGALAANYGGAAPWRRDLYSLRFNGLRDNPGFIFGFSPQQEFIVHPRFLHDSCGLSASTRLLGQP